MHQGSDSIETLRQRSEGCRAELKATVNQLARTLSDTTDEIKAAVSPDHLKAEARAYANKRTRNAVKAVKDHATNYPLQTLAIGAAVTYPLLGLARMVPVPMALIGAGLLLSRSRTASSSEERSPLPQSQAGEAGRHIGEDSKTSTSTSTQGLAARAAEMGDETRNAMARLVNRNPFLFGGLALAAGGLIAASLPALRLEDQALGKATQALKDKTRRAAAEAVGAAKTKAAEMANDITAAVRSEGVGPEVLNEVVETATDKVAAVVKRAVNEATGTTRSEEYSADNGAGGQNGRF